MRGLEDRVVEANLQLEDCTLRAPYDGVIAQRFVEESQNIRANDPVVMFQDVDEIDVVVDVPETVMAVDIRSPADSADGRGVQRGTRAPVPGAHQGGRAGRGPNDPDFPCPRRPEGPAGVKLLPGMTATVTVTYRRARILGDRILVPIAAVFKEARETRWRGSSGPIRW